MVLVREWGFSWRRGSALWAFKGRSELTVGERETGRGISAGVGKEVGCCELGVEGRERGRGTAEGAGREVVEGEAVGGVELVEE